MPVLARLLFTLAAALLIGGLLVLLFARLNLPLGRLPGDLSWRGRGWNVYFPLGSSILLSVVLSLILWAVSRLR